MKKKHVVKWHLRRVKGKVVPVKAHVSTHKAKLKFYDLKTKKSHETDDYRILVKSGRRFAVAKGPSGNDNYRILGKAL